MYMYIYKYIYIYIYIHIYILYTFTISSCFGYGLIPLTLVLTGKDGGLSTLCHSCEFDYQQKVLEMFSGPIYLPSKDKVA